MIYHYPEINTVVLDDLTTVKNTIKNVQDEVSVRPETRLYRLIAEFLEF